MSFFSFEKEMGLCSTDSDCKSNIIDIMVLTQCLTYSRCLVKYESAMPSSIRNAKMFLLLSCLEQPVIISPAFCLFFLSESSQSSKTVSTNSFIQLLPADWIWYVSDDLYIVPYLIRETIKQIYNFSTDRKK